MIKDYGDPANPIWVVINVPYPRDVEQGWLFSSGYGFNFKKTWKLGGAPDPFITSCNNDLSSTFDSKRDFPLLLARINQYQPKLVVALGDEMTELLAPITKQKNKKASALAKWAGSLCTSPDIKHPHYVIGTYDPQFISTNWNYHEIQGYIDFGRVRSEFEFIRNNGTLNPLPVRTIITNPTYDALCDYLRFLLDSHTNGKLSYVSSDIETIRPKKNSPYNLLGHPGYLYTLSLAPSPKEAISYCLWDYPASQAYRIWSLTNAVLTTIPQIGQNYYTFDSHHLEALGFKICLSNCQDTMLRHHILWPSLPHKLQFQTRQYTREPYYKDDGKVWSSRFKQALMKYNCLDSAVTYEIWEAQELEFNDRPYLR